MAPKTWCSNSTYSASARIVPKYRSGKYGSIPQRQYLHKFLDLDLIELDQKVVDIFGNKKKNLIVTLKKTEKELGLGIY